MVNLGEDSNATNGKFPPQCHRVSIKAGQLKGHVHKADYDVVLIVEPSPDNLKNCEASRHLPPK